MADLPKSFIPDAGPTNLPSSFVPDAQSPKRATGDRLKGKPTGLGDSFMGTLAGDFANIPANVGQAVAHPINYIDQSLQSFFNVPEAVGDMYAKGQWGKLGARALEMVLPFVGEAEPMMAGKPPSPHVSSELSVGEKLTNPGVVSAATNFIPFKKTLINNSKTLVDAWKKAKRPDPLPMPPSELDPYNNPRGGQGVGEGMPAPPSQADRPYGPGVNRYDSNTEYGGPEVATPKPKPEPKPKPAPKPTKPERDAAARAMDPYTYPPGGQGVGEGLPPMPQEDRPYGSGVNRPGGSMEYGGREPAPAPPPKPEPKPAPTKQEREAAAKSLDPYQYPPPASGVGEGLPKPPSQMPAMPTAPADTTYRSGRPPMDYDAPPAPRKAGGGGDKGEAAPNQAQQDIINKIHRENAAKAAELDKLKEQAKAPGKKVPEDSVALTPKAGTPKRYADKMQSHLDQASQDAYNKDLTIAQHLKGEGVTPESWLKLELEEQNKHVRLASGKRVAGGGSKIRDLGKGKRSVQEGIQDIYETLKELYGQR